VVQWPGGVNMQLYWHTTPPNYAPLGTIPENRIYIAPDRVDAFIRDFLAFATGRVVSDDKAAAGAEIGKPTESYRRVRLETPFGKLMLIATDGHLPFPYGREMTGYAVADLDGTIAKAKAAGVAVLVQPQILAAGGRRWSNSPVAISPRFMPRKNERRLYLPFDIGGIDTVSRCGRGRAGPPPNSVQSLAGGLVGIGKSRGPARASGRSQIHALGA